MSLFVPLLCSVASATIIWAFVSLRNEKTFIARERSLRDKMESECSELKQKMESEHSKLRLKNDNLVAEKHRLDVELAKAKVAAENAVDIKAAEIRAAQAEKQNSITDSLAIKREPVVVLKRDGFFSNKYLVALREDVMLGGRVVYTHTTESFWT